MTENNILDIKYQLERSIALNCQMQNKLLVMRDKLESLIRSVKNLDEANELEERVSKKKKEKGFGFNGAHTIGDSFYFSGSLFFRDADCRTCPNNEDYKRRKMENEMFPMDLNIRAKHQWTHKDKQRVVLAVKEQIIDSLKNTSNYGRKKSKKLKSEKLAKLMNMIPIDFRIDWEMVPKDYVLHRHSAKSCEAIWNSLLHPSLNCSAWSKDENLKLVDAAKQYNFQNWQAIAKAVGQRSEYQCIVQYKNKKPYVLPETHTKWSKEDDKRLIEVVKRNTINGTTNWVIVNTFFPHKCKTTLHSRYNNTLNPHIKPAAFTPAEDRLLIAAVKEYGTRFHHMPRTLFPNRSPVQLRAHYNNVLVKRHKQHPWSVDDDIKLVNFVTKNGNKWSDCEKYLNEKHTRQSCRTRYIVIKKYLEENPDCSIESLSRKSTNARLQKGVSLNNWKEDVDGIFSSAKAVEQKSEKKVKKNTHKNGVKQNSKENIQEKCHNGPQKDKELSLKKKIKRKPKIAIKTENPYSQRLGLTERKLYDFFKYAYSFQINRHSCDNIEMKSENFTMVLSALNPQIRFCDIDSSIPKRIKQSIKQIPPQLSSCETPKLLSPDWSTSMGFRALCLNTLDISSNTSYRNIKNHISNDYIKKFRERFRLIFYSTIILSRLDPTRMGISEEFQEIKYE